MTETMDRFRNSLRDRHIKAVLEMERATQGSFANIMDEFSRTCHEVVEPLIMENARLESRVEVMEDHSDRL